MLTIGCKIDEVRIDGRLEALRRDLTHYTAIGIEAVELPVHGLDAIKNGRLDERRTAEVLEVLSGYDFSYSVHAPNPLNLMDIHHTDLHLSVFRASLTFARKIGAGVVVYHCGRYIPEEIFHIRGKQIVTAAEKRLLLEQERKHLMALSHDYPDIVICMENARPYLHHSPYTYAERLELLKNQVEDIDRPNVKITLDVGHLHMAANFYGDDLLEAVTSIRPHVAHTHIHDNFGGTVHHYEKQQTHQIPFGRGDNHMPVGWGIIPIQEILTPLLPVYRGMLMMELRSRYFSHIEESKENLMSILSALVSVSTVRVAEAAAD